MKIPRNFLPGCAIFAVAFALGAHKPAAAVKLAASASLLMPGKICAFVVLAFACASLAHFLDFAQGKGEILRGWRVCTFRAFWFKGRAKRVRTFDHYVRNEAVPFGSPADVIRCWSPVRWQPSSPWRQGLYKMLGGCIYCASVWAGSFFYFTGAAFLAVPFWLMAWAWPLFVGLQFVFIDVLFKLNPHGKEESSYPGPALKIAREVAQRRQARVRRAAEYERQQAEAKANDAGSPD